MGKSHWWYEVMPLIFGRGRIIHTDGHEVDALWWYESYEGACRALLTWHLEQFEGEPQGWVRAAPPYHRRRPGGDATREYVER